MLLTLPDSPFLSSNIATSSNTAAPLATPQTLKMQPLETSKGQLSGPPYSRTNLRLVRPQPPTPQLNSNLPLPHSPSRKRASSHEPT